MVLMMVVVKVSEMVLMMVDEKVVGKVDMKVAMSGEELGVRPVQELESEEISW